MKISEYILSGNLLGIWIVLLLGVAGLLLAKIDLRHRRVLPKITVAALLGGIPTFLAYFQYPAPWIFVSSLLFLFIVITLFATIRCPLPHESLLLLWISKKKFSQRPPRDQDLGNRIFRFFITTPGKFRLLRKLLNQYSKHPLYLMPVECQDIDNGKMCQHIANKVL